MRIDVTANQLAFLIAASVAGAQAAPVQPGAADKERIRRGEYLATYGGCNDCHTPKKMTPNGPVPDPARLLSGHPAGAPLPPVPPGAIGPDRWGALANNDLTAWVGPWGTSFAANLTPDESTGLGGWTFAQFNRTMRTGKHLGAGRPVLPPMPWFDIAVLTERDMRALFAYLTSLPPIVNQVPRPIPLRAP